MASSTDSPGPLTKTVEDAAIVTKVISGHDPFDATTSPTAVPDYKPSKLSKKLRIGIPKEYLEVLQPETKKVLLKSLKVLEDLGHSLEETSLIHPKYSIGVYTIVQRSEVSSNLARYDGIRYGQPRSFFGQEAKRRIMLGTYALSSGYHDKYYLKAQKIRTLIINDFNAAFSKFDLLFNPASPGPALQVGASANEPMFGEMQDILVEPSSIAGLTGISVPGGFIDGLPVSFGLIGPQGSEGLVLNAGYEFQQHSTFHTQKPKL
jgi:aspartyl-tRNA(Asn)/glutamyl-tRNA(Gln) amidotransferase subunit A